jgi:hypothetical protein
MKRTKQTKNSRYKSTANAIVAKAIAIVGTENNNQPINQSINQSIAQIFVSLTNNCTNEVRRR